jgi:hypothetical protein
MLLTVVALFLAAETSRPEGLYHPSLVELSVGLNGALGERRWTTGLSVGALLGPVLSPHLNVLLELSADVPESEVQDAKRWSWLRAGLLAAPVWRIGAFDIYAGAAADLNVTVSEALGIAKSYRFIYPLGVAGVRLSWVRPDLSPWAGLCARAYLGRDLPSPIRAANLPAERWVAQVGVGAAFTGL